MLGYEACREIRENGRYDPIRIIGMSTNYAYEKDWKEAGADSFLWNIIVFGECGPDAVDYKFLYGEKPDMLEKTIKETLTSS
ncbi:hypothetical protein JXC34_03320 [Candidatus Woesearchaeota archaeon]|nr:hypothetical protein [Candidatus Woesearchaeota archaeon]